MTDKVYYHHSGYIGGIKARTAKELLQKKPEQIIQSGARALELMASSD